MQFTKAYVMSTKGGEMEPGLARSLNFGSEEASLQVKSSLLGNGCSMGCSQVKHLPCKDVVQSSESQCSVETDWAWQPS